MRKMRVWLVALFLVSFATFGATGAVMPAIEQGTVAKDWAGVLALLITGAVLGNVIVSYLYARRGERKAGLWAIGALVAPYAVPLVLALLRQEASGVDVGIEPSANLSLEPAKITTASGSRHFASVVDPPSTMVLKGGSSGRAEWLLDRLRLFCVIVPGSFKWRVVTSSQEFSYHFPDLMSSEDAEKFYGLVDELCSSGDPRELSGIKIALAGYATEGSVFELRKLRDSCRELMAGLYRHCQERGEKLQVWLDADARVTLHGGIGSRAMLDKTGFHLKRVSLRWPEVFKVETETINGLASHMYVLPADFSEGLLGVGKAKYALARIAPRKKELYVAECLFWKTCYGLNGWGSRRAHSLEQRQLR